MRIYIRYNKSNIWQKRHKLQFGEYLKSCRLGLELTQEEFVVELFMHDITHFENLEPTTISKWEHGHPQPSTTRKLSILKYFQKKTGMALPFFSDYSTKTIEKMISQECMMNFLGNSKQVVLNFPSYAFVDDLSIQRLSELKNIDRIIDINMDVNNEFNYGKSGLSTEHFKRWVQFPDNIFIMCEQHGQFYGLLFTLRVKPDIFEKLINFEMKEADIASEHFATINEPGADFFLSFIALNKEVASLLFTSYYAQLITNQKNIVSVGGMTMVDDARKLIENMCIKPYKEKQITTKNNQKVKLITYKSSLKDFMACEGVIKMLFTKETI